MLAKWWDAARAQLISSLCRRAVVKQTNKDIRRTNMHNRMYLMEISPTSVLLYIREILSLYYAT